MGSTDKKAAAEFRVNRKKLQKQFEFVSSQLNFGGNIDTGLISQFFNFDSHISFLILNSKFQICL